MLEHFRSQEGPAIHLYLEGASSAAIEAVVRETSLELGYHFVVLDGEQIPDEPTLLRELARAYDFPKYYGDNYERLGWDGANDWLGDLTWLTGRPNAHKVPGFLLLFREPLPFFKADATDFALFLRIVDDAAAVHRETGVSFHMLVGPLSHKAESLISLVVTDFDICPYLNEDQEAGSS
ncbi:MAG TPA: barstar family protein [Chloroflexia bacterium]|jgi:hypothetical protein